MDRKGVTLIEIIVVLAIIALTATLAVPSIAAWMPNYRLRTAARDLLSTLRNAQMKAVSTNTEHRVLFSGPEGAYIVQRRTTGGTWVDDETVQRVPTGVRFHQINLAGDIAEFNPNATSSAGNVILKNNKGREKKIVLFSATGRVRIE